MGFLHRHDDEHRHTNIPCVTSHPPPPVSLFVFEKTQDGDLLGLYLELSAVQQEELRVSSGAQSSTLAICELIDSLNMFVAGD